MKSTVLRLDSFSSSPSRAGQMMMAAAVDEAFHQGHEKGLNEGRELSLDALTQALCEMRQEMQARDEKDRDLHHNILNSLAPALDTIVDLLGQASETVRLRATLTEELARLVEHTSEQALVVRCPPDLRPDIEDCLAKAQLSNVQVEDLSPEQRLVELVAGPGTITFDPALMTATLKSIINDIKTED